MSCSSATASATPPTSTSNLRRGHAVLRTVHRQVQSVADRRPIRRCRQVVKTTPRPRSRSSNSAGVSCSTRSMGMVCVVRALTCSFPLADQAHRQFEVGAGGPAHEYRRVVGAPLPGAVVVARADPRRAPDVDIGHSGFVVAVLEGRVAHHHDGPHGVSVGGDFHALAEGSHRPVAVAAKRQHGAIQPQAAGERTGGFDFVLGAGPRGGVDPHPSANCARNGMVSQPMT